MEDLPVSVTGRFLPSTGAFAPSLFRAPLKEAIASLVATFEREYLARCLRQEDGRAARAAARAGIDVRTMRDKLRRLGVDRKSFQR